MPIKMGPEYGTPEYRNQVDAIVKGLSAVPMQESELPQFLMMWIMDETFSRAAICEAEKVIKQRMRGKNAN